METKKIDYDKFLTKEIHVFIKEIIFFLNK
jgi:hypothetical protein